MVIHCCAGVPRRTFFFGCPSSSSSDLPASLRFCPTFCAASVLIGRFDGAPHSGVNSAASAPYFGSSWNCKFTTASMYFLNAAGVYRQSASADVAIFFLHTKGNSIQSEVGVEFIGVSWS